MTTALATIAATLDKLIRRLGSSHDGERLATVRAIERVLKTAGRDWHDLADAIAPPLAPEGSSPDWRRQVRFCADRAWLLSVRERDFIDTLTHYRNEPSEKQGAWLHSLFVRLQGQKDAA